MDEQSNPHEDLQRLRKAVKIADVLDAWSADAETVADAGEDVWRTAAAVVDVPPASDRTRALVVSLLTDRARLRRLALAAASSSAA